MLAFLRSSPLGRFTVSRSERMTARTDTPTLRGPEGDSPTLRGKPVAVGYGEARGVVCTASYEARKFGVRSAMPSLTAKNKCPELIFVPPRFEAYHEVSMQIRDIFLEYTDLVEPLSLDEAFLDVTVNHKNNPSGTLIAQEILQKIFKKTADGFCGRIHQ